MRARIGNCLAALMLLSCSGTTNDSPSTSPVGSTGGSGPAAGGTSGYHMPEGAGGSGTAFPKPGDILWKQSLDGSPSSLLALPDGATTWVGLSYQSSSYSEDIGVYEATGKKRWNSPFDGAQFTQLYWNASLTPQGQIFAVGDSEDAFTQADGSFILPAPGAFARLYDPTSGTNVASVTIVTQASNGQYWGAFASDGTFVVTGDFANQLLVGQSNIDSQQCVNCAPAAFLAAFHPDATLAWTVRWRAENPDGSHGVAYPDFLLGYPDGGWGVMLSCVLPVDGPGIPDALGLDGRVLVRLDAGGNVLWSLTGNGYFLGPAAVRPDGTTSLVVAAKSPTSVGPVTVGVPGAMGAIVTVDATGQIAAGVTVNSAKFGSLAVASDGTSYFTGQTTVTKVGADGSVGWTTDVGGIPADVVVDAMGRPVVAVQGSSATASPDSSVPGTLVALQP